jgi:hypothetical protein
MKSAPQQHITLQLAMMQPYFHSNQGPRTSMEVSERAFPHIISKRERRITEPRSRSIPIHKGSSKIKDVDLKLREEEALADLRDYVMFRRIVDRIAHQNIQDSRLRRENDMCLAHVIGIRNGSEDQLYQAYKSTEWIVPKRAKLEDPGREDGIFELEL